MPLADLVDNHEFRIGLAAGAAALLVVLVAVLLARREGWRRSDPLPVAGIALAVASLIALGAATAGVVASDRLAAGVVVLALGPLAVTLTPAGTLGPSWLTMTLATVPGAALVAWAAGVENDVAWVPPLVFVAIVLGGALVADFDGANARTGLGPVLMAVAVLAMYTALPDTEEVTAVVGAALPLALLGTPRALASLGRPGASSSVGLVVWVAAAGGRARPGAVVGAIACLGVMLVEPLVRRALRGRWRAPGGPLSTRTILVVLLDLGLVAATSRVSGLETSGAAAAMIAVLVLAAAALVLAVLLWPWGEPEEPSRSPTARRPTRRRSRARPATRPMRR